MANSRQPGPAGSMPRVPVEYGTVIHSASQHQFPLGTKKASSAAIPTGKAVHAADQGIRRGGEILTFPGTIFRYRRTTLPLNDCLTTLPSDLRLGFKQNIETIITEMHALGFATGVKNQHKAGYRTFQEQYDMPAAATRAGPGESFHNYLCAVDLGFLQWIDVDGKEHNSDYWLGQMDAKPNYTGFSKVLWEKRNSFSQGVHRLSFEVIHLQSVPQDTSGRTALLRCLNEAAKKSHKNWLYRRSGGTYQSTLGKTNPSTWTAIGSAKQMWNRSSTNCTSEQCDVIRSHMESAEIIAKSIEIY
jgi:hypothetical protein